MRARTVAMPALPKTSTVRHEVKDEGVVKRGKVHLCSYLILPVYLYPVVHAGFRADGAHASRRRGAEVGSQPANGGWGIAVYS